MTFWSLLSAGQVAPRHATFWVLGTEKKMVVKFTENVPVEPRLIVDLIGKPKGFYTSQVVIEGISCFNSRTYDLPPCWIGIRILLLSKTMLLCSSFRVLPGGSPCLIAGSKRLDSSNDSAKLHLHKGRTVWAAASFGGV